MRNNFFIAMLTILAGLAIVLMLTTGCDLLPTPQEHTWEYHTTWARTTPSGTLEVLNLSGVKTEVVISIYCPRPDGEGWNSKWCWVHDLTPKAAAP